MAENLPIRTQREYDQALARLWEVFDAEPGTPEEAECEVLADLVSAYDARHYPIPNASPTDLIQGRLDALGLCEADLIPHLGSRERVAEVLAGREAITLEMARALHQLLGIAIADLLPARAAVKLWEPAP